MTKTHLFVFVIGLFIGCGLSGCTECTDNDSDGYYAGYGCGTAVDCDDNNANVNPNIKEGPAGNATCSDGLDNNCDRLIDYEDLNCQATEPRKECTDNDSDGYYAEYGCGTAVDCDDNNANASPNIIEGPEGDSTCFDGVDNDCDKIFDEEDSGCHTIMKNDPWVIIVAKFSDNSYEPHDISYYDELFANKYGGLDHFWREISYDKMNLVGSKAYGWYTLPKPQFYYCSGSNYSTDRLLADMLAVADPDIDFTKFEGIALAFYSWAQFLGGKLIWVL